MQSSTKLFQTRQQIMGVMDRCMFWKMNNLFVHVHYTDQTQLNARKTPKRPGYALCLPRV